MEREAAAKAIIDQMQQAHHLWDAFCQQGGDPGDLMQIARDWRDESGRLLSALSPVFGDPRVGSDFLDVTAPLSRSGPPFDLLKSGIELLEALLRDMGVEAAAAAGKPAAKPEEKPKGPDIRASFVLAPTAGTASPGSAPSAREEPARAEPAPAAPPRSAAAEGPGTQAAKVLAEVRVALEMTPLPAKARADFLVQVSQLEQVFRGAPGQRDAALGRSCIRSLSFAADSVPNIASRLMSLLDALES